MKRARRKIIFELSVNLTRADDQTFKSVDNILNTSCHLHSILDVDYYPPARSARSSRWLMSRWAVVISLLIFWVPLIERLSTLQKRNAANTQTV